MAAFISTTVLTIPPTPPVLAVTLPVVPAVMPLLTTVMPMAPAVNWRERMRNHHHTGWRRRGVDHTGWRGINDMTGQSDLRVNREMAHPRMDNHGRLHKDRMGTARLGQTQHQSEHEQGFARPSFEHQHCHVDSCEMDGWPMARLYP